MSENQNMPEGATFVKLLTMEINSIADDELIVPKDPIAPNETVIGKASDAAKRLYTRWHQCGRAMAELQVKIQYDYGGQPPDDIHSTYSELNYKAETYQKLFWLTVNDELHTWTQPIGIRIDWDVVEVKGIQLPGIIKGLFGM